MQIKNGTLTLLQNLGIEDVKAMCQRQKPNVLVGELFHLR